MKDEGKYLSLCFDSQNYQCITRVKVKNGCGYTEDGLWHEWLRSMGSYLCGTRPI